MANVKAKSLDLLATPVVPVAAIDNTAPAEQLAPTAPTHVMPYSLSHITATMQAMESVVLTDYLNAFYDDTARAVTEGRLEPVLKLILDKGFARHWTEHNSTFSKIPESAKLDSIREAFKYWSVGVLTKSAYDALFKTPTVTTSGSGRGNTVYKTLANRITLMSQSVDVELSHRKHYQKVSDNLLKSGKVAYDAMLAIPTAAHIIKAAEAAILAEKPATPAIDLDFS